MTIAARNLSSLTIPHFLIGVSLSVKPIGSKRFLPKSTNGTGDTQIESNCRISADAPSLQGSKRVIDAWFPQLTLRSLQGFKMWRLKAECDERVVNGTHDFEHWPIIFSHDLKFELNRIRSGSRQR